MTKIKIHIYGDSIGTQLFDRYYAFKQSSNTNTYQASVQIEFGPPDAQSLNIAFASMPTGDFCRTSDYDFVFVDNAGESLETSTLAIGDLLTQDNVYLISGAFLSNSHVLKEKNIPFNHNIRLFHDCMTRGFYPQYYQRANQKFNPIRNMVYINGANRSCRQYFIDLLKESNIAIDIKTSLGTTVLEIGECIFEDSYDRTFREMLCTRYPLSEIMDYNYYDNSVKVGIDQKFGSILPGYFLLNEYYQYHMVVFPETGWINNQHFATEKIYKCFVSGSIPFPISGACTHRLYNDYGYQTGWNLLPTELQEFDSELDHEIRYKKIIQALKWLNESDILSSESAYQIRKQNQLNFYKNTLDLVSVSTLDSILRTNKKFND